MPGNLAVNPTVLVEKIVKHLINYISGFAEKGFTPESMTVIANWYQLFIGKVQTRGLGFLDKED